MQTSKPIKPILCQNLYWRYIYHKFFKLVKVPSVNLNGQLRHIKPKHWGVWTQHFARIQAKQASNSTCKLDALLASAWSFQDTIQTDIPNDSAQCSPKRKGQAAGLPTYWPWPCTNSHLLWSFWKLSCATHQKFVVCKTVMPCLQILHKTHPNKIPDFHNDHVDDSWSALAYWRLVLGRWLASIH